MKKTKKPAKISKKKKIVADIKPKKIFDIEKFLAKPDVMTKKDKTAKKFDIGKFLPKSKKKEKMDLR